MSNEHRDDREALEFLRRGHPWKGFMLAAMTRLPWKSMIAIAVLATYPMLPSGVAVKIASAIIAEK